MTRFWTKDASFIDAHLGPNNVACVAIVDDELASQRVPLTKIAVFSQGSWLGAATPRWDTAAVSRCLLPIAQYAIVGVEGQVQFVGSGDVHEEKIVDGELSPKGRGLLRGARAVDGVLYVCGMKRQVYRRNDRDNWTLLNNGFPQSTGIFGFESIDGFSQQEIYAVGWEGEIWQFDGSIWTPRDSGTNVILQEVVCADNGKVYAIGRGRKLVVGRAESWQTIDLDLPVELCGLAWFQGVLYACSSRDVFTWDGFTFSPLPIAGDRPATLQYLNSGEGGLCAVGPKDLFRFDGTAWTRID